MQVKKVYLKSFEPKKDLPFVPPQVGVNHEVQEEGEHLMLKTPDGQDLALSSPITDNEYFTAEIELVVSMSQEQLVEMIRDYANKQKLEQEAKLDKTIGMFEDLVEQDPTMLEPFHDLLVHIEKAHSDKYEAEILPAVNIDGLKWGGTKSASGFNVGNAVVYLKRYLSEGFDKSYNEADLHKAIHFLLFEIYSRKASINGNP